MFRRIRGAALLIALSATSLAAQGDAEFPIAGTYLRDMVCKGDGSQRPDLVVVITPQRVVSPMGDCRILSHKKSGPAIQAHVECRLPGDQLILGDVTFTIRDARTIQFEDQDHTSDATLHRCGE